MDRLLIAFGSLLPFPLVLLFQRLCLSSDQKHLFNILFGMTIGYLLLGTDGFLHTFISSLVTYAICSLVPPKRAATIVWIWALGYMLVTHIIRMMVTSNGHFLDHGVIQMLVTTKLSAFASCLYYATRSDTKNEY